MRQLFLIAIGCVCAFSARAMTAARVVDGLDRPVFVTAAPGDPDRLFVIEQHTGLIRIVDRLNKTTNSTPFLTVTGLTKGGEQGLLGLAFHPDFQSNGFFYVNYTTGGGGTAGKTQVARFTVSSDRNVADPASKLVIIEFNQPEANHNGGWIGFGPDGFLYIATGDGGSGNDPHGNIGNGQDTNTLLGKLLRIDVNGGAPYSIPDGNPFKGDTAKREEIWAFGLRNPFRCSFDRLTGDLWIGDVGQNAREEIDFQPAGSGGLNYGWRPREGFIQNPSIPNETPVTAATDPVHDYDHSLGLAVIGGYRYRGQAMPALQGAYFFADNTSSRIWTADLSGALLENVTERQAELAPGGGLSVDSISSFGEDVFGELYICDLGGELFKIVPTTAANTLPAAAIANGPIISGTAGANIAFSAAGSADADGAVVLYSWNFGDGSAPLLTITPAASHTFAADGNYTLTLNVYDERGDKSAPVSVQVSIGTGSGGGAPGDTDGDGFSDELELGVSTSPTDSASTPFNGAPAGATQALDITRLQIKLNFSKPASDSIHVQGTLQIPAGFSPSAAAVVVNAGGVVKSFILDEKGKSPRGDDTFAVRVKARKGMVEAQVAKYQLRLKKGDFNTALADEGLISIDATNEQRNVQVTLLFNNTQSQSTAVQIYSAKAGKSGRTMLPK